MGAVAKLLSRPLDLLHQGHPSYLKFLDRGDQVLAVREVAADQLGQPLTPSRDTTVTSGHAALEALQGTPSDVLVSDIGMSGMDGYQLIRRIRAGDTAHRRIPALALTAYARAEDRKKAMLAGYQMQLAKPIDIAELVLVIAGLVGKGTER
jgi:CheY-like chemotaxis protein